MVISDSLNIGNILHIGNSLFDCVSMMRKEELFLLSIIR